MVAVSPSSPSVANALRTSASRRSARDRTRRAEEPSPPDGLEPGVMARAWQTTLSACDRLGEHEPRSAVFWA
jgi:hypothetical protein